MKILVTGSAGFLGQALIPILKNLGHTIIGIDIKNEESSHSDSFFQKDLRNIKSLPPLEFDLCIHLASSVGGFLYNAEQYSLLDNESEIFNGVASLCKTAKCSKIIFTSSINVFEADGLCPHQSITVFDQQTPYARAKVSVEKAIENTFQEFCIVRPTNLFGANQHKHHSVIGHSHVIPELLYKIKNATDGKLEVLGNGSQSRNFLHVSDAAHCIAMLTDNLRFKWINIRSEIFLSMKELAEELLLFTQTPLTIHYNPAFNKYEPASLEHFSLEPLFQFGWEPTIDSISQGLNKN